MSGMNLKEYSDTRNISYSAVRKQVQRFKGILGDNVTKEGKNLILNKKAVEILDFKQKKHVEVKDKSKIIDQLKEENNTLKNKVISLQDELLISEKKLINYLETKQKRKFHFLFSRKKINI